MVDVKKGDRIKVIVTRTYEGPVEQVRGRYIDYRDGDGVFRRIERGDTGVVFAIIERADDPSKDLPGTVRENTGLLGGVYVKVHNGFVHVVEGFHPLTGTETVGAKVGTVPGSPAAKAENGST